jgi:hypothetical protein
MQVAVAGEIPDEEFAVMEQSNRPPGIDLLRELQSFVSPADNAFVLIDARYNNLGRKPYIKPLGKDPAVRQ